ncbi:hypothetical protein BJ742DRAFT_709471 [Cladochytrium replicatum]|nr:hypothetical protein BJ742DRAFT_709471 [Cladochytrium replicatum]
MPASTMILSRLYVRRSEGSLKSAPPSIPHKHKSMLSLRGKKTPVASVPSLVISTNADDLASEKKVSPPTHSPVAPSPSSSEQLNFEAKVVRPLTPPTDDELATDIALRIHGCRLPNQHGLHDISVNSSGIIASITPVLNYASPQIPPVDPNLPLSSLNPVRISTSYTSQAGITKNVQSSTSLAAQYAASRVGDLFHPSPSSTSLSAHQRQIQSGRTLVIHAQGSLVVPAFVDPHLHLDKCYLNAGRSLQEGSLEEAIRLTWEAKTELKKHEIVSHATRAISDAVGFGTTHVRTHVEIDPYNVSGVVTSLESGRGLLAIEALFEVQDRFSGLCEIQLAIFAQEGITNIPGMHEALRAACEMGSATVSSSSVSARAPRTANPAKRVAAIGSAPYVDPNPRENIITIFDLAQEFDLDVDFHLDYSLEGTGAPLSDFVAEETIRRGYEGRVLIGHCTRLSTLPSTVLESCAVKIAKAGILVVALPGSDLYMMGREPNPRSDARESRVLTEPIPSAKKPSDVASSSASLKGFFARGSSPLSPKRALSFRRQNRPRSPASKRTTPEPHTPEIPTEPDWSHISESMFGARRGLAPLNTLSSYGVRVAVGTNNLSNAFQPHTTTPDPLDSLHLAALSLHIVNPLTMLDMITRAPAEGIRADSQHRLVEGEHADLVILEGCMEVADLLGGGGGCPGRWVIRGAKVVARSQVERRIFW